MNKQEARHKSVAVETRLRKMDPEMAQKYQESAVKIINMLKESQQLIRTEDFDQKVNLLF